MFSFDNVLGFRKFFCCIERGFWNPCFISKSGLGHFDKCDSKFSKFFNFSTLFSTTVQILRAKENGIQRYRLQRSLTKICVTGSKR